MSGAERASASSNGSLMASPREGWDIRGCLSVLSRHKLMIATAVSAGLIIALAIRLQMISRYEAEAQIVLDVRRTHIVNFDAVLSGLPPAPEVLRTEMDVISSRAMAERVVDHLRPAEIQELVATTAAVTPLTQFIRDAWSSMADVLMKWIPSRSWADFGPLASMWSGPGTAPSSKPTRDDLVDLVMDGLKVSNDGRSYTIRIGFASADPQLASTLSNRFAGQYLASQLDLKADATRRASNWLNARLVELRQTLEASEGSVESYRRSVGILQGKGTTVATQQISDLNAELVAARGQRLDAESRLGTARALLQSGGNSETLSDVLSSGLIQSLRTKQAELKRREAAIKSQYTSKYPELKSIQTDLVSLEREIGAETGRITTSLANQAEAARLKEQALERDLTVLREKFGRGSDAEVKLQQLQREADANRVVYEAYLARYKETSEQEKLQDPDAYQISSAVPPRIPSYPRTRPLLALGMIFGGLVGAAGAFLRETLDQRLRSVSQVEETTGLPVLALLPSVPRLRLAPPQDYVLRWRRSSFNEALRTTWAAISLSQGGGPGRVVVIMSSVPEEGKTAYCLSLGRSLAADGRRVLVVDGDLRRPGVAGAFGSANDGRLRELLEGRIGLSEATQTDPMSGAHYIGAQDGSVHPQQLLGSGRMCEVLEQARVLYDVVLIDTPPILIAADAALVARYADHCLFFVRWGATSRERVSSALHRLALYRIEVTGIVLTQVNMRRYARYASGEGYYRSYGTLRQIPSTSRSGGGMTDAPTSTGSVLTTGHLPSGGLGEPFSDRLLTLQDAASYLRLSVGTIRRLVAKGRLPVVRLGRTVRVRPQDLEALVNRVLLSARY